MRFAKNVVGLTVGNIAVGFGFGIGFGLWCKMSKTLVKVEEKI